MNPDQVRNELQRLPELVAGVNSPNPQLQLEATTKLRRLLSIERNPPIQVVIDSGVVRFLNARLSLHVGACSARS